MRELTSFELALVSGGHGECEGDGEESDICVIGHPPDLPNYPPPTPLPPSWGPPPEYGGGGSGPTPPPPAPDPCLNGKMDVAADGLKDQTNAAPFANSKEYLSAIYKDASGTVRTYGPVEGVQVGLLGSIWEFPNFDANFAAATGMGATSIIGSVHNHPYAVFGHDPDLNRYPSGADWLSAERDIQRGADPANYSLYVIDTAGNMREFPYSMKDFFNNMHPDSKRMGLFLPPAIDNPPPPTCS